MQDAIDSMPTERSAEQEGFANRRLIRPSFNRNDHNHSHSQAPMERRERPAGGGGGKKTPPPETTNAENFYYQKQMQGKTPMVIVLRDGEEIHGVVRDFVSPGIGARGGVALLVVFTVGATSACGGGGGGGAAAAGAALASALTIKTVLGMVSPFASLMPPPRVNDANVRAPEASSVVVATLVLWPFSSAPKNAGAVNVFARETPCG